MRNITRLFALPIAAAGAFALTACDSLDSVGSSTTESVVTVTQQAAPQADSFAGGTIERQAEASESTPAPFTQSQEVNERIFLQVLRDNGITQSDEDLIAAGGVTCRLFDSGATPDSLVLDILFGDVVLLEGATEEDQATIAGAAVGALCSEYSDLLDS